MILASSFVDRQLPDGYTQSGMIWWPSTLGPADLAWDESGVADATHDGQHLAHIDPAIAHSFRPLN